MVPGETAEYNAEYSSLWQDGVQSIIMVAGWSAEYNAEYTSWWHDGVQSIMQSIHHGGMTECRV